MSGGPTKVIITGVGGAPEGTAVRSTGEAGGTKFLRENGDGTSSWVTISGGGDMLAANNLSDVSSAETSRTNLGLAIGANVQAYSSILAATTASFTTATETKLAAAPNPQKDDLGGKLKFIHDAAETDTGPSIMIIGDSWGNGTSDTAGSELNGYGDAFRNIVAQELGVRGRGYVPMFASTRRYQPDFVVTEGSPAPTYSDIDKDLNVAGDKLKSGVGGAAFFTNAVTTEKVTLNENRYPFDSVQTFYKQRLDGDGGTVDLVAEGTTPIVLGTLDTDSGDSDNLGYATITGFGKSGAGKQFSFDNFVSSSSSSICVYGTNLFDSTLTHLPIVHNLSQNGLNSGQIVSQDTTALRRMAIGLSADVVVIQLGINDAALEEVADAAPTKAEFKTNISTMITRLRAGVADIPIVLMSPLDHVTYPSLSQDYRVAMQELADETDYVSHLSLQDVLGANGYPYSGTAFPTTSTNGLHLVELANGIVAQSLFDHIGLAAIPAAKKPVIIPEVESIPEPVGSLRLDATSGEYVDFGADRINTSGDFTILACVSRTSSGTENIIAQHSGGSDAGRFSAKLDSSGRVVYALGAVTVESSSVDGYAVAVGETAWVGLAADLTNGSCRFSKNGRTSITKAVGTDNIEATNTLVGRNTATGSTYSDITIHALLIFDKQLSVAETQEVINYGVPADLVGNATLATYFRGDAADITGGADGTVNGSPTFGLAPASGGGNATHTGDVTGATVLTIADGAVDLSHLSATGTPTGSKVLKGDNTWGEHGEVSNDGGITITATNAAGGAAGGGGIVGYTNDGAATGNGDRLGYFLLGGAEDSSDTMAIAAGIQAYATETWTGSQNGAELRVEITANGATSRTVVGTFDEDGLTLAGGLDMGDNDITNAGTIAATDVSLPRALFTEKAAGGTVAAGELEVFALNSVPNRLAVKDDTGTTHVLATIKASQSGTWAAPITAGTLSPTFAGASHSAFIGATCTVTLPPVADYEGRTLFFYSVGAFVLTFDPTSSETIVREGTLQTGGVTCTLDAAVGNFVAFYCDGGSWITAGFKGTLAVGS